MKLFLLRHEKAEDATPEIEDHDRKLLPKGKERAFANAKKWKKHLSDIDVILSSPYARAKQTAEIFASVLLAMRKHK